MSKSILHFFIIGLILFLSSLQLHAKVTADVSANPVVFGESFQLTINSDTKTHDSPDLSPLYQDFDIHGQSQSSNVSIINGNMQQSYAWVISLSPKRMGQITIPAIHLGNESTQPFQLQVVKATSTPGLDQKVFIKTKIDNKSVYVQQQILLTIKVYISLPFAKPALSSISVNQDDAVIEKVGEEKSYNQRINGIKYHVFELQYAIFPQHSGSLTISPIQFTANISDQQRRSRDPFDMDHFFQRKNKRIRTTSEAIDIEVLPAKTSGNWLPAMQLNLSENWQDDVLTLKVGEPVTRTIMMFADGLAANQLPPLNLTLPKGLKHYPNQPQLENQFHEKGITGTRQEKIAIIASKPGIYDLPPIEVAWWNTQTNKKEIARLPKRRINVEADENAVPVAPPAASPPVTPDSIPLDPDTTTITQNNNSLSNQIFNAGYWPWVSLGLGFAWLLTLIAFFLKKPASNIQESKPVFVEKNSTLKDIKHAIDQQNQTALIQHLISWTQDYCQNHRIRTLQQVGQFLGADVASSISEMEMAKYSHDPQSWNGKALWKALKQLPKNYADLERVDDALQPLYPQ